MKKNVASTPHSQQGFTYLGLLFSLVVMGLTLSLASEIWSTNLKREKEQELLFVGHQFREAIRLYYETSPSGNKEFPPTLEDLLLDPRFPNIQRHLRRLYTDPLTGAANWGIITSEQGGIQGVYSQAGGTPIKVANFDETDKAFRGKQRYSDWQFVYVPEDSDTATTIDSGKDANSTDEEAPADE